MRILQIHNFYAIRGGECGVVDDEHRLLQERGHEVIRFTKNSQDLSSVTLREKMHDYAHIPYNARVGRDLLEIVDRDRPDVAHVHNVFPLLSPSVYAALKKRGIPIVQTMHNFRMLCPNGTFFTNGMICERCQKSGFMQAVYHRCVRGSIPTSVQYARAISGMWHQGIINSIDTFIALNNFGKNKLKSAGIPDSRISICGNYAAKFESEPGNKRGYFLYLGRLSPEKGIHTLLSTARRLQGVNIKIAGTGPLELEVKRQAESLGNVDYVGYVYGQQKQDLIRGASAMIVPSEWYENFPISIVEAMSSGTPVIASNIGGLPEMIDDGCSGLLFEPGDAEMLTSCIKRVHENPAWATSMGLSALERARDMFSPEKHTDKLEAIYQAAVESPGRTVMQ